LPAFPAPRNPTTPLILTRFMTTKWTVLSLRLVSRPSHHLGVGGLPAVPPPELKSLYAFTPGPVFGGLRLVSSVSTISRILPAPGCVFLRPSPFFPDDSLTFASYCSLLLMSLFVLDGYPALVIGQSSPCAWFVTS